MIQLFRSKVAKQITVVFFALLMVVFLLTSVDLGALGGAGTVGTINGAKVDARTYETIVQQQTEAAQRQSATALSLEDLQSVRDRVWEQLIQQRVLEAEYERYGIEASDEEVVQLLRTNPPQQLIGAPEFQTDSQFDLAKYQRWLTSPGSGPYVEALGAEMREQVLRSKLLTLVTADIYLSDAALWQQYRDRNEQVRIELTAIIPRNIVPDSLAPVTNEEVEAYFREHRDEFKRSRTAYVSGIAIPRQVTAADTAAALERVRAIRQEIVDGAPFAEIAARESADPVSGPRGGDLGEWTRGQFDPAFDSVAFRIPLNTLSEPVLSSFGYHLIEVTSRRGDTAAARHILVPVEVSGENRDRLEARVDTLDRLAAGQADPAALDSVARMLGLRVSPALPIQQGSRAQLGNQVIPDVGVWAFQARPGEVGEVIETPDAFYLFRLDSLSDESEPTLASVRPSVELAARDAKRREVARAIAADFLKRVGEGSSAEQAARALGLAHREFGPFPRISPPLDTPELVGTAFGLDAGERSGVIETDQGLYVIRTIERIPADSAAFVRELETFRADAIRQTRQARVRNYLAALRAGAEVEDKRVEAIQRAAELQEAQQAL
ncbi:MAG TPA: peptidylprolyl isomerase [Gemmatimonadales bacterium]|nr:peptidylprolyl isomerase [Gemmatimonadales bacterium]